MSAGSGCGQQQCGGSGACSSSDGPAAPPLPPAAAGASPAPGTLCMKCRKADAELIARGREPLCHPCLHEQLLGKVRNAVRLHSLVLPGDAVALAFTGGPSSAILLRFLCELRNPRSDRPARGKVHFTLHVLHIDESAAAGLTPEAAAAARAAAAAAAAPYCQPGVAFHCVPLEAVFEEEEAAGTVLVGGGAAGAAERQRARLAALLAAVRDPTGRDDLARHLRTRLLLRCAAELGCARVARGDCSTALAAHIVAAASKGCGYSLAGDVRLVDARYGSRQPSFFLPLREVSARELRLVCGRWALPLAEPLPAAGDEGAAAAAAVDKRNINSLAAAFIAGMEKHNPGSVPNILNTISKLEAFPWNEAPQPAQQQRRQQQQHEEEGRPEQQGAASVLCPICLAPLADDELPGSGEASSEHTSGGSGAAVAAQAAGCCLSCSAQILGSASSGAPSGSSEDVAAALPAAVRRRMAALSAAGECAGGDAAAERLRAQIAEFLIDE